MTYSRLRWNHNSPSEPTEILSEYDAAGRECRKVEVFPDGSLGFADALTSSRGTGLSLIPRPPDEEVVAEHEFEVVALSRDEFERAWVEARRATSPASPGAVA